MNPKVTIGLCAKNAAKIVRTAFDSISAQDYPHKSMKLVIVDNDSSDNTLSLAMEFAKGTDIPTFVTSNKNEGLGATRQMAVDNAVGDYIVWVDDDLVLRSDYIKNQVDFMEKNPNVGAAQGVYTEFSTRNVYGLDALYGLIPPQRSLNYIGTGGSIFRLKALQEVGGFDVRIKGAGEDLDISRRIKEAGWALAHNNSATYYEKYSPATPNGLWKRNFGYGYANHFLFHKYGDQQFLTQYFPPFALYVGLKMSSVVYRLTNLKKAFVFFSLHSFNMISGGLGFTCAHLDGYGHVKNT
jgi:glycosyltransferase involved in cell wall biosynthesis